MSGKVHSPVKPGQRPVAGGRAELACFALLLAVLVWAPLPFASNREWGGALLCLLLAVIAFIWLLLVAFGRIPLAAEWWRRLVVPLGLLLAVQLWVLLQLTPLPRGFVEFLSPQAHAWHIRDGSLTLSLDSAASQYYLLRGVAVTLAFFLTAVLVNTHRRLEMLLLTLVASGTFQAIYGAFMTLSGLELGFFVEKYSSIGVASGTFVNRNHFAGYLVMCLASGSGLLLAQLRQTRYSSWRERLQGWLQLLLSPTMRLRLCLAIMVIALVLSLSRTGNLAFFLSLALAGGVVLLTARRFSWRIVVVLSGFFLVDVLILGRWFGFDRLVQRLESMQGQQMVEFSRYWMNHYGLDYLRDFPLTGSGGGSFVSVFPNYQGAPLAGYYQHAHNDYLEFALELGLPATLLLALLVLLTLREAVLVLQLRHTPLYRGAAFAVVMAVSWMAIHSLTDFNMQIPANATTFATLLAVAWVARSLPAPRRMAKV